MLSTIFGRHKNINWKNTELIYERFQFLDRVGDKRLLEFYIATDSFKQDLLSRENSYDPIQAQEDAMVIYDR